MGELSPLGQGGAKWTVALPTFHRQPEGGAGQPVMEAVGEKAVAELGSLARRRRARTLQVSPCCARNVPDAALVPACHGCQGPPPSRRCTSKTSPCWGGADAQVAVIVRNDVLAAP